MSGRKPETGRPSSNSSRQESVQRSSEGMTEWDRMARENSNEFNIVDIEKIEPMIKASARKLALRKPKKSNPPMVVMEVASPAQKEGNDDSLSNLFEMKEES